MGQEPDCIPVGIPQLIQYLRQVEAEERKSQVHINEHFRNLKCFQKIFGSSTSFKLIVGRSACRIWLMKDFNGTICPLNGAGSPNLSVHHGPDKFVMSIKDEHNAPFLIFEHLKDDVTVSTPDMQEPIGKIVRRKADDDADIFCYATKMKFTMKNSKSHGIISMKISDSESNVLGAASATMVKSVNNYIILKEFVLHIDGCIAEPTKVMFLAAFSNWAKWSAKEANGQNIWYKVTIVAIIVSIVSIVFIFYYVNK